MKRAALALLIVFASCSRSTVHLATGSSSPSASAIPTATPSATPSITKAPAPAPTAVTPGPTTTYSSGSGVNGKVVAGPTCPVERAGHPCPPRPVTDATVTASPGGKTAHTDSKGAFKLALAPGSYTLSASSRSVMHCTDQNVSVQAHRYTTTTINCDTGIR